MEAKGLHPNALQGKAWVTHDLYLEVTGHWYSRTPPPFQSHVIIHHSDLMFSFFTSSQTSQVSARSVEVTGEEANTIPNVEAILEDFQVMGKGLVKSVEARTEKWSF